MKKWLSNLVFFLLGLGLMGIIASWQQKQDDADWQDQPSGKVSFNPRAGKKAVTADEARKLASWTRRFREVHPDQEKFSRSHFFNKELVRDLMKGNSMGIRAYHAIDDNGTYQTVLVGTDKDGNDLFVPTGLVVSSSFLLSTPEKCPSNCDAGSILMQ